VPVPPGFRQVFPTAMPPRARHLRRVAPTDSLVANDLHGSEDRVKDVSSAGARDAIRRLDVRCIRVQPRMRTAFPSSAILGTSDVIGRAADRGGDPLPTDGPTKVPVPT
jgi:hypothetical protein